MIRSRPFHGPIPARRQRGVVLVVALIFLVLLTLLALSSSGSSLLQEKMVGGTRNAQLAEFGAESALRAAEARLWKARTMGVSDFVNCGRDTSGACYKFDPADPVSAVSNFRSKTDPGWTATGAQTYDVADLTAAGEGPEVAELARAPTYIIEDMGLERPPGAGTLHESGAGGQGDGATGFENHIYRITARSVGGNDKIVRVLQSTFAAKAN
ncbi:MAG TPA: pilus assembly protein [Rhodanobacteraceae bacterium]|nr:pilus assembly protein [Rhodanobacteraceae bacterium]